MSILAAFVVPHPPLLVPEVGRGEEKEIHATTAAYKEVARQIAVLHPETVVLLSPHAPAYGDYFQITNGSYASGSFEAFGAPKVKLEAALDEELIQKLSELCQAQDLPGGTLGGRQKALDHGTLVPLYFIQPKNPHLRLVRIALSGLPLEEHYRLGMLIAKAAEATGRSVVVVASGDLSHKLTADGPYGYAEEGPVFDRQVTQALAQGDFYALLKLDRNFTSAAAECGLRSILILAGALDRQHVAATLLSYEGPFGVGYAVASFYPGEANPQRAFLQQKLSEETQRLDSLRMAEDPFIALARYALETKVRKGETPALPPLLPPSLTQVRAGVFVSLKLFGELRGCIGTIAPVTASLGEEILRNAVLSGTEDPRFSPVTPRELPLLVYSVDVLGPPEPISGLAELDPLRYGVIVRHRGRSGLLLPDLPGVTTAKEQVAIALRKAGIAPQSSYGLERFEVVRHT